MANHRTPVGKAELTGSLANHPGRFRDRVEPKPEPLGNPPDYLSESAQLAWFAFASEWPWLVRSDGAALVPLCMLRAAIEVMDETRLNPNLIREYRILIGAFGGTPTTKTKISAPSKDDDEDPFEKLDGPRQ